MAGARSKSDTTRCEGALHGQWMKPHILEGQKMKRLILIGLLVSLAMFVQGCIYIG